MAKTKKRSSAPDDKAGETPWNRPITRRDFVKTGIATGGVAGAAVVAGRGGLQALQVGSPAAATSTVNPFASQSVTFTVNGVSQTVQVEPRETLALVLRENLGLVGTKMACNRMECGACTVLVNGVPRESCQYLALWANGATILTVEAGLPPTPPPGSSSSSSPASTTPVDPVVAALQAAWVQEDGGQCCYCSPGNIMAATALLKSNPNPTVADIKTALSGNLCQCGNYMNIIASIQRAATNLGGA